MNKDEASTARRDQTHGLEGQAALPAPGAGPETAESSTSSNSRPSTQQPPFLFRDATSLLRMTRTQNLTIAQLVWQNERALGKTSDEISHELMKIWSVMDGSIREGVSSVEERLPGRMGVRRRAAGKWAHNLYEGQAHAED